MCLCLAERAIADKIKCLDWSTVGLYWVEQPAKSRTQTHKDLPWPVEIVQTDFRGNRMAPRHTTQCVPPQSRSAVCLCVHNVLDGETGVAELKNIHDWLRPSSNQRYLETSLVRCGELVSGMRWAHIKQNWAKTSLKSCDKWSLYREAVDWRLHKTPFSRMF